MSSSPSLFIALSLVCVWSHRKLSFIHLLGSTAADTDYNSEANKLHSTAIHVYIDIWSMWYWSRHPREKLNMLVSLLGPEVHQWTCLMLLRTCGSSHLLTAQDPMPSPRAISPFPSDTTAGPSPASHSLARPCHGPTSHLSLGLSPSPWRCYMPAIPSHGKEEQSMIQQMFWQALSPFAWDLTNFDNFSVMLTACSSPRHTD